jgi:glucose/arabinose dehydrogenase
VFTSDLYQPYGNGDLKATAKPQRMVERIPWVPHYGRDVVVSPDGKRIFYSVGSRSTCFRYEDFMTGFVVSDEQVWGRPVGIAVAKDGSLIVTEDGNGTMWRVSHQASGSATP